MVPHDADHELRVREALFRLDARSRAAVEDCPECRRELAELRSLGAELDGAAALERELLAQAAVLGPGAAGARAAVVSAASPAAGGPPAEDASERASRRSRGRRIGWPAALAAAAALVLFLIRAPALFRGTEPVGPRAGGEPQGLVLGADQPAASDLSPSGAVPSFEVPFRWDLADDGWFVLRVYSDEQGARPGDPPLATSARIEGRVWSWPAPLTRSWPRRIRWEVQAFDATGLPIGAAGARAWRTETESGEVEAERAQ